MFCDWCGHGSESSPCGQCHRRYESARAGVTRCRYPLGHRDKHPCSCTCALDAGHKGRHACEVAVRCGECGGQLVAHRCVVCGTQHEGGSDA